MTAPSDGEQETMRGPFGHRAGGQTLSVWKAGGGPRVVVLHGGPGLDHHVLVPFARHLAGDLEVWLPDLPGHGATRAPDERLPDLHALVERTTRWLAALDGPLVLVGHSLGAWIAREALRRGRLRPAAAVLVAPPAGALRAERSAVRARVEAFEAPDDLDDDVDAVRAEFLAFTSQETDAGVTPEFRAAVEASRLHPPWTYRALLRQLHRRLLRATPRCTAPCPVLVVCGDRDRTTPPGHAARVAEATTGATLRVVPGEGHVPCADGRTGIAEATRSFLAGLSLQTG